MVGQGDVGSALDALLQARGAPVGRVEGFVIEQGTGAPISDAHIFAYQGMGEARASRPWNEWRSDVGQDTRPDGSFAGTLPPGDWTLLPHQKGRAAGQAVEIQVVEGLNAKRFELIRSPTQSESDRFEAGESLSAYQVISRSMEEQQDQIMEAVGQIELVADLMPTVRHKIDHFPIVPYAITNPIWADVGGDGWQAPGLPSWLREPEEPGEKE